VTGLRTEPNGGLVVRTPAYVIAVSADGLRATLTTAEGAHLATLRPLVACDRLDARDETLSVAPPRLDDEGAIEVGRRSTIWDHATTTIVCDDEGVELRSSVTGSGALGEVRLLAGRSLLPGRTGMLPSGSSFRTVFSPGPADPRRVLRAASESVVIGAAGDSQPGRGHWFFTPAPLYLALCPADGLDDPSDPHAEVWVGVGVAASVDELGFVQLVYEGGDRAFALRLDYEGHTRVAGTYDLPTVLVTPGTTDPYGGLRRHREQLAARGAAPRIATRPTADWWHEPIFCGWGAQRSLAAQDGGSPADHATQASYDAFLGHLEERGVVPGTIVIDDKWQGAYGTCEPDPAKWPDLRGWVAARHSRGQRVLLWWRAWSGEGIPGELCVRRPDGEGVGLDPDNPSTRALLEDAVCRMLGPDGLDADGLKIDFTASTPSGVSLEHHGPRWGIALLHELLATVYGAAKRVKPDALVITHAPHPAFVDVADMIRLNDMLRLDDLGPRPPVLAQMRYRAAVVRAACPELLVDTDDWCVPDLETWRAYLREKTDLGVPALYYVGHLDATGETLTDEDYAALAESWAAYRAGRR
jgi:hypothetical protein